MRSIRKHHVLGLLVLVPLFSLSQASTQGPVLLVPVEGMIDFGAIAMSIANWRRVGVCTDMSNQQAANDCAMAKCGHNYCEVHVEFPAGQCAAVVAGHFATAANQSDAMEEAKRECWRERGRASDDCRRRVVAGCNG